jgi:Secretion system C-terminal sorting domain
VLTGTRQSDQSLKPRFSPNPFSDFLLVEIGSSIEAIEAFNTLGQPVPISSDFGKNHHTNQRIIIPTANWQPGIYYIFVRTSAQTSSPIRLVKH